MQCAVPPGARVRILDAAEQLVASIGGAHLTLDAVAQRAGVSKGGLLHHFPSKDLLLVGMIERHIERTDQRCALVRRALPDEPASDLKAWIIALLQPDPLRAATGAALFGAAVNNPGLLDGLRRHYADHVAKLTGPARDFALTATILLAVDGLLLGEVWRTSPFTEVQRAAIIDRLMSLAERAFEPRPATEQTVQ